MSPLRPLAPCREPGCPELVRGGGRCEEHQSDYRARRNAADLSRKSGKPWRDVYRSRDWRLLSKRVLLEEPVCRRCGAEPSTVADHVIPIGPPFWGRPLDRSNVQGLSRACHAIKTSEDQAKVRAHGEALAR